MGLLDRLFGDLHTPGADGVRILDVPTGNNVRELGGFDTPAGPTLSHRFLRSGSVHYLSRRDINRLKSYGVTRVLDLRGQSESPELTDVFARERDVQWVNIEFYGRDISERSLLDAAADKKSYLAQSYLHMLSNAKGVRRIIGFLAETPPGECALFHCAAGMDRTGMCSMLLLGSVGVPREQIFKDYLYSFATIDEVDEAIDTGDFGEGDRFLRLSTRYETIRQTYDAVCETYGSVSDFLRNCGVTDGELDAIRAHLLEA